MKRRALHSIEKASIVEVAHFHCWMLTINNIVNNAYLHSPLLFDKTERKSRRQEEYFMIVKKLEWRALDA